MSRPSYVPLLALSLAAATPLVPLTAQVVVPQLNTTFDATRYTESQLDNLVGPIALYPDALLAQVLVAATFPDQVADAAQWVREHGTAAIDDQPWDVSVKSVAHYQSALNMMADKGDWTATLGRAYAYQSSEVMAAVQRMRRLADTQGNLLSTAQQQVMRESNNYVIVPAQPRVIYVPVYDPVLVYTRPIFATGFSSRYWSFGVGFPIGGWLNYDLDWGRRSVYYNGWDDRYVGYGGGWRARARPFIQVTNIYISPRYRDVYVNRDIRYRVVDYRNVDRYAGYHRDVYFDSRRDGNRDGYRDGYRDGRSDGRTREVSNGVSIYRTAQPRSESGSASPEGYRNGPQRDADRRDEGRGDATRGGSLGNGVMLGQPMASERRREPMAPTVTAGTGSNESRGSEARGSDGRGIESRGYDARRGDGRAERAPQPRAPEREARQAPPQSAPQARPSEPQSAPTRSAQPRNPSDGNRGSRERRGE
ncbi:DUF3300 domain-containing protein [Gemmatimonas groenlandica]|uniref:DUF3300 domain-containing protein n=1 Tax=Gemmatimonas groenlandica TaxID=2732249 RepID=A0A6M4ITY8_9BACT|nr:DUF3300 domain-containing protein [Gemmatimonas groenlandica]QJR37209.1 DUF3300 domain-containing protein [Gemmatimonas groenlandica]